jgi:hypothetical protein
MPLYRAPAVTPVQAPAMRSRPVKAGTLLATRTSMVKILLDQSEPRHVTYIEVDLELCLRGSTTRIARCICEWRGPERGSIELAADDALTHERSNFWITRKPGELS